jgi:tetratricopeptide (TPR) repeat protein
LGFIGVQENCFLILENDRLSREITSLNYFWRNTLMKKVMLVLAALCLLGLPLTAFAGEGPMSLPDGSNAGAVKHNKEGIDHWGQGHYDVALKHFQAASKADSSLAQTHFNEAISLDKLGRHGEATMHFKAAKKNAKGNKAILDSAILNGHLGH